MHTLSHFISRICHVEQSQKYVPSLTQTYTLRYFSVSQKLTLSLVHYIFLVWSSIRFYNTSFSCLTLSPPLSVMHTFFSLTHILSHVFTTTRPLPPSQSTSYSLKHYFTNIYNISLIYILLFFMQSDTLPQTHISHTPLS